MTNNSIVYFMVGNKVVYLSIYIYIYSGIYRYIKLFFSFPKKNKLQIKIKIKIIKYHLFFKSMVTDERGNFFESDTVD